MKKKSHTPKDYIKFQQTTFLETFIITIMENEEREKKKSKNRVEANLVATKLKKKRRRSRNREVVIGSLTLVSRKCPASLQVLRRQCRSTSSSLPALSVTRVKCESEAEIALIS
jgi:hypothetical protein